MILRRLITPPAAEPLDLESEVKAQVRVDGAADDARLAGCVTAARMALENERGIALITQVWEVGFSGFPCGAAGPYGRLGGIELPLPPLQTVDWVHYVDSAGATQTWDPTKYTVVNPSGTKARRAWIVPKYGEVYPTTLWVPEAVTVKITVGYGLTFAAVPGPLRQAMLLHVGELWRDREQSVVGTIVTRSPQYDRLVASCVELRAA
jgi:uncharacterized phiE125 gp8 family phage protein